MTAIIATNTMTVIFGLGLTGLSVVRYLSNKGQSFVVVDTRAQPPGLPALTDIDPNIRVYAGALTEDVETVLLSASEIVISPGISRALPIVQKALQLGISVVGDIELFLREAKAPVIGITGSNGKTTVTTLVGLAAQQAGLNAPVAGNIGVPALDVLTDNAELYILELSSFQLESLSSPGLSVGCVLNVSEDHMDRYSSLAEYCMAKQRIYWGAQKVVYNLNDTLTQPPHAEGVERRGFGLQPKIENNEIQYLWNRENAVLETEQQALLAVADLKIAGQHNIANALAVFALCDAAAIPRSAAVEALTDFCGLPHRCQWIADISGTVFINDSKATNVGAAVAAISGLYDSFSSMTLIVGGDGKGADFSEFGKAIDHYVSRIVLIGRDAPQIAQMVSDKVEKITVGSMDEAVEQANKITPAGGVVLLSPACASFDMFSGYEDRGARFIAAVEALQS